MGSIKVKFAGVAFADSSNEVINVVKVDVFDPKVIDNQGNGDFMGLVEAKAWVVCSIDVAIFCKVLNKIIMGNFSSLFEAVTSTFNFGVDIAINNLVFDSVVTNDLNGDEVKLETDILGIWKEEAQVHVGNVGGAVKSISV